MVLMTSCRSLETSLTNVERHLEQWWNIPCNLNAIVVHGKTNHTDDCDVMEAHEPRPKLTVPLFACSRKERKKAAKRKKNKLAQQRILIIMFIRLTLRFKSANKSQPAWGQLNIAIGTCAKKSLALIKLSPRVNLDGYYWMLTHSIIDHFQMRMDVFFASIEFHFVGSPPANKLKLSIIAEVNGRRSVHEFVILWKCLNAPREWERNMTRKHDE